MCAIVAINANDMNRIDNRLVINVANKILISDQAEQIHPAVVPNNRTKDKSDYKLKRATRRNAAHCRHIECKKLGIFTGFI